MPADSPSTEKRERRPSRLGAVDHPDDERHRRGGVAALARDDRAAAHRVTDDVLALGLGGCDPRGDQREQHHPPTRGKPPNCDEMRETPTILRGCERTKTHWFAVGQLIRSQRPSGEKASCRNAPLPR